MARRPVSQACLVLVAATALACAGAPPPIDRPEVAVPASWPAAETGVERGDLAVGQDWWRDFDDPRLDRLIAIAFDENRDLRGAAARLDLALAQARIAGADRKPQASWSADGSRRKQNFIGLPIPGTEGRVLSNTSTTLGTGLNVSWEADLWGRLAASRNAAGARADAAALDLAAARLSLAGQTAKAWFAFLESGLQLELARATVENRAGVRERIERRYLQGLRSPLELRLAMASEASARAAEAAQRRIADLTRGQLEVLTGRDPEALDLLDAPGDLPALPSMPAADLPAEVLGRRPDLLASERRLAAAGLDVRAARKALYPRLSLGGSSGSSSTELSDLLDSDFSVWSLAASLLQPVFQGGRLRAGVAASEGALADALARHEGAVLTALSDIERQLTAGSHLGDQQSAVTRARDASDAARDLAEDRYFSGLADYLSVLEAEERATRAAAELLQVERLRLEQRVDLLLALGGGFAPPAGATEPVALSNADPEPEVSK